MSKAYHIAQSGRNKGKLVPCYAKNCRNNIHTGSIVRNEPTIPDVPDIKTLPPITRENIATQTSRIKILIDLASDTDENVLYALAANPNLPEEAQQILLNTEDPDVFKNLACNPNLTENTFIKLAEYEGWFDSMIHSDLMNNKKTPASALMKILPKTDWKQKMMLAAHRNASPELLNKISENEIEDVIEFSDIRYVVSKNRNTSTHTLDRIIETCDAPNVLANVASHRNLSQESVFKLYNNDSSNVRVNIASRKDLPDNIILALLIDIDKNVRTAAYNNPSIPEDYKPAAILAGGVNR